jgi:hypothetical protein
MLSKALYPEKYREKLDSHWILSIDVDSSDYREENEMQRKFF